MKKISLIFTIIFVFIFVVACNKDDEKTTEKVNPLNISKEMLFNNIYEAETDEIHGAVPTLINIGDLTISSHRPDRGLLIVSDDDNKVGVWSIIENKLIVPLRENYHVEIQQDSIFGVYIYFRNLADNQFAVYDIFGNEVLKEDDYNYVDVYGSKEEINEDEYVYYEHVESLTQGDFEAGLQPEHNIYKVNPGTKQKELVTLGYKHGDIYENEIYKLDLADYGLPGYYFSFMSSLNVYNEETDKLVQKINLPDFEDIEGTILNGHMIYQKVYELDQFAENYSFIKQGKKYLLYTKTINLLTGEEKLLNVDYQIEDIYSFKDQSGIIKYAMANIYKIESKLLITNPIYDVVINHKGQIIADVSGINIDSLRKLDEDHIIDDSILYDGDLTPIVMLPDIYSVVPSEKIIIFSEDGKYGAIDYNGRVVIPFNYSIIFNQFYQGKTLAMVNSRYVIVDLDNNSTFIEGSSDLLDNNLIYTYNINRNENNFYDAKLINYNNETLHSFELTDWNKNKYTIGNVYGDYDIYRFNGTEGFIYLSVKK